MVNLDVLNDIGAFPAPMNADAGKPLSARNQFYAHHSTFIHIHSQMVFDFNKF
jgi:hypothetical protein